MFINLFLNIEYTINDNQAKSCAVECTEISIKKQALANTHYRVSHVPVFKRSKAWESSWLQMKVKVSVTSVVSDSSWPQGQPGSSVHGILQASILEWVAVPFLQGIFLTQGSNLGFLHCRQILYHLSHQGSPWLQRPANSLWRWDARVENKNLLLCDTDSGFSNRCGEDGELVRTRWSSWPNQKRVSFSALEDVWHLNKQRAIQVKVYGQKWEWRECGPVKKWINWERQLGTGK